MNLLFLSKIKVKAGNNDNAIISGWLFFVALVFFAFALPLHINAGEDIQSLPMEAMFKAQKAATGDIIPLELKFNLPDGASLDSPVKIYGLEENKPLSIKKIPGGLELMLLADALDTFRIDELSLAFKDKNGKAGTFKSEAAALSVVNNLAKDPLKQEIRNIKGLVKINSWENFLYYGLAFFAVIIIAAFLFWFFARKKRYAETDPPPPAHITALAALKQIQARYKKGEITEKEYYFDFSLIIRTYMGSLRDFPAAEMTLEEISAMDMEKSDREILALLRIIEMVKFAKGRSMESSFEKYYLAAKDYIIKEAAVIEIMNEKEKQV